MLFVFQQYTRHKILINNYTLNYPGATASFTRDVSKDKTEYDILRDNHRFLWSSSEDENEEDEKRESSFSKEDKNKEWEKRLAKKYYDQLFKEYAICDLSRFKENKVAMRWRTESEVVQGKGQFVCGEKTCHEEHSLRSWEVNFKYEEQGEVKNALVKLRLCPQCSDKLNFHHKKKEVVSMDQSVKKGKKKRKHKKRKHKKRHCSSSSDEDEDKDEPKVKKRKRDQTNEEDIEERIKRILESVLL